MYIAVVNLDHVANGVERRHIMRLRHGADNAPCVQALLIVQAEKFGNGRGRAENIVTVGATMADSISRLPCVANLDKNFLAESKSK